MRRTITVLCTATTVVVLFLLGAGTVTAQSSPYTGLDIIFIIDQSGSMKGTYGHPEPNDPHGLRFYGVRHALSWLGTDQYLVHPDATYNMAVVNFGTAPETVNFGSDELASPWAEVIPGTTEKQWLIREASLMPKVGPDALSEAHLGNTNFLKAFEEARGLFDQLDDEGRNHQRAVVVLTDGQPHISDNTDVEGRMATLDAMVEEDFPSPRYAIYVVALNDADADNWPKTYRELWIEVTEDPDRARLVEQNETDVGLRFQQILEELTQGLPPEGREATTTEIEPGIHTVPPYLRELEFTFFKAITSETTLVNDPSGQDAKAYARVSGEESPIEGVFVSNPEPGEWEVTVPPGSETKITMREIPALGTLEQPKGVQYRSVPAAVVYQLIDTSGDPLPAYQDPTYQLQVTTTVEAGAQSWPINLRSAGQSRYEAEFVPTRTGSHAVYVRAVSHDLDGGLIKVFEGRLSPFEVRGLSAESRMPDNRLTEYVPSPLRYSLIDDRGLLANVSAPIDAQAIVTDSQGAVSNVPLELKQGSELVGSFTPSSDGRHRISLVATTRDSQGQEYTVFDVAQPSLTVMPPTMQMQTSPPPFRQYRALEVTLRLRDASGDPLVLDPTQQDRLDVALAGKENRQEIPMVRVSPGEHRGVISPTQSGPQTLASALKVVDPASGQEVVLVESEREVQVLATTLVKVEASRRTTGRQPVRSVLRQPMPLRVELEMKTNGKRAKLSEIVEGPANPADVFELKVFDEEGRDCSDEVRWQASDQPGVMYAEGKDLGRGRYVVEVEAVAPLRADYMYSPPSLQFEIHRVRNPVLVGLTGLAGCIIAASIATAVVTTARRINLRKHPCQGYLTIVDSTRQVLWNGDLDEGGERQMNQQRFETGTEAPLSLVETLEVTCNNDQESEAGIVHVKATLSNGDVVGPRKLTPHDEPMPLVPGTTWLFKDLTEGDLDRIPLEGTRSLRPGESTPRLD